MTTSKKRLIYQASTLAFTAVLLILAMQFTKNETWLSIWLMVFIFIIIPSILLTLSEFFHYLLPRIDKAFIFINIAALFFALIGFGLGKMAVWSEHPSADLHQYFVILFPLGLYLLVGMYLIKNFVLAAALFLIEKFVANFFNKIIK